jgi:hypothetical protein
MTELTPEETATKARAATRRLLLSMQHWASRGERAFPRGGELASRGAGSALLGSRPPTAGLCSRPAEVQQELERLLSKENLAEDQARGGGG